MKRWAFTIAAGPKYWSSAQKTGHEVVQAAQRMHLVVSSKRWRSSGDCRSLGVGSRLVVDQERQHLAVGLEERVHVHQQVLAHRQAAQRLHRNVLAQLPDQHLARQPVGSVDQHRVRPADAVGAGAAERERAVQVPLDVVQQVQDPVHGLRRHLVGLDVGCLVRLGIEAPDPQRHVHQ